MITKRSQGNSISYDIKQWIVDTEDDVASIPRCPMGSTVQIISTGKTKMIDSNGNWHDVNYQI